uniref:Reverse transcriptase RNase H-like domain-containing protein n=1 Tax=Micrurus paraensis TaxID=1970185 RepID=A0A2D4KIK5_9SAUR
MFHWVERHVASIRAEHISGDTNTKADWLSRAVIDQGEWQMHPHIFQEIVHRFGTPQVDLFATPQNSQLPRFYSRYNTPGAEGVNALRGRWPQELLYAFPPLPLIPQVIRKLIEEQAEVVLLTPFWPRRQWFADLRELSVAAPWRIPEDRIQLLQGPIQHPDPQWLKLTAWRLKGRG